MHRLAGKTVKLAVDMKDPDIDGRDYRVEDLWKNVSGRSWKDSIGNPAALKYAIRCAAKDLPVDDNVLYGKVGHLGHLVHESEIEEKEKQNDRHDVC